jgi:hypothetical protein
VEKDMSNLSIFFMLTALLLAMLTTIAIWSRRRMFPKMSALVTAILILPLSYASFSDLLSKPKPVNLEWWFDNSEEATVVSSIMREGEGIFLWLQIGGIMEPRSYVMPWDQELAEQLNEAQQQAEESNSELRMRMPFETSLDELEPKFYAMPQMAPPPKDFFDGGPQVYEQPGRDA